MNRATAEAICVAKRISEFVRTYAPMHKTDSENTVKTYKTATKLFLEYLEAALGMTPSNLEWGCFQKENIEGWVEWMRTERGNAPSTCNVRLSSLREFLRYVAEKDVALLRYCQEATCIKKLKCLKRKVKGLTRDAVKAIMQAPDKATRAGRRDIALMVFMYATAARIDEVLSVKIKHLSLTAARPCVSVVGKGSKTRTLYILPRAVQHLEAYIGEFHGAEPDPESYLFYSRRSNPQEKLTQPAVAARLRKHAKAAHRECSNVPLGLHAHQFRHARASHWLQDGVNIVQVSFLLGHEQLQTTMVYLDITTEDEMKALEVLEGAKDKAATPKWKNEDGTLASFCGL